MHHGIGERIEMAGKRSTLAEHLLFARHLFAYEEVSRRVAGKRVLEIGCGTAYGTRILAKTAREVVALDIDPELIRCLQGEGESRIRFMLFDGRKVPFADHSFEGIVAFQVLEHVRDDRAFLHEIRRLLHPQGVAVLTTPNRLLRLLPGQKPFNLFHEREYSPEDLHRMAERENIRLTLKGVFGDSETLQMERERLRPYHTWIYRQIFQRLPSSFQQTAKKIVLALKSHRREQMPHHEFHFFLGDQNLNEAIDLWLEISP